MFEQSLTFVNRYYGTDVDGLTVPSVVVHCVEKLQTLSRYSPDMFREYSSFVTVRIEQLMAIYDQENTPDWEIFHAGDAVGLLATFLRLLPTPIIPENMIKIIRSLANAHIESGHHSKNPDPQIYKATQLSLQLLQAAESNLLQYLIGFSDQVVRNSKMLGKERKQGRNWMAVFLAPLLSHLEGEDILPMSIFLELLIDNVATIWSKPAPNDQSHLTKRVSASFIKMLQNKNPSLMTPLSSSTPSLVEDDLSKSSLPPLPPPLTNFKDDGSPLEPISPTQLPDLPVPSASSTLARRSHFPVIRLVPLNQMSHREEYELRGVLKVCRTKKKEKKEKKDKPEEENQVLFLDSKCISRDHAEISWIKESRRIAIKDHSSTCGTWVNGKRIPPNMFVTLQGGDCLTFGENIPEEETGNPKAYEDHEVPPQNRCVRMELQVVSFPQAPVRASTSLKLDEIRMDSPTVEQVSDTVLQVNTHVLNENVRRKRYQFFIRRNPSNMFIEKVTICQGEKQTHSVDLGSWKKKGMLSVIKLPDMDHSLSLTAPEVTLGQKIREPTSFFQFLQDGEVVGLFDRVHEGEHHSLEFVDGAELVASGSFKARNFRFWLAGHEEKQVCEVFGRTQESRYEESFSCEISEEFEGRTGPILMAVSVTILERVFA